LFKTLYLMHKIFSHLFVSPVNIKVLSVANNIFLQYRNYQLK